jgi:hypothetical protein
VESPDNEGEGTAGGETVVVSVPGHSGGTEEIWISRSSPSVRAGDPATVVDAAGVYTDSAGARAGDHYGVLAGHDTNGSAAGQ